MENGICGFCHREDVEDVCGQLHVEKTAKDGTVAAHHKCMQYSALLTQYKFQNFGGFKISKVLDEYKRGKVTKCSICFPKKKRKSADAHLYRGATAGCAVKSCRKSFHYFCARNSDTAITKRLVVHVKSKGQQTVLYRVFCSKEHEQQYRKNLRTYMASSNSKKGIESDESGDDEDDDEDEDGEDEVADGGYDRVELSQDTNSTFINLSDSETTPRKSSRTQQSRDNDENANELPNKNNNNKRRQLSPSPVGKVKKSKKARTSLTNGHSSDKSDKSEPFSPLNTKEESTSVNPESSSDSELSGSFVYTNVKHISSCNSDSPDVSEFKKPRNTDNEDDRKKPRRVTLSPVVKIVKYPKYMNSENEKSPQIEVNKKTKTEAKINKSKKGTIDTVALCIVEDAECSLSYSKKLEQAVTKTHKVKSERIFIWQNLEDSLTLSKQNMVYFIKDLAKHYVAGDREEVEKLLFDRRYLEKKEKTEYRLQGSFLQDLGDHVLQQTQQHAWSFVKSQLADTDIGSVVKLEGTHNLVLLLSDSGIDIKGGLREKLGVEEEEEEDDMIVWTSATVVTKIMEEDDDEMCTLEKDTILTWLKEKTESASVYVYPSEEALKAGSGDTSVAEDVASQLRSTKTHKRVTSTILVFKQMDKEVVKFVPYCRKVFQSNLSQCKSDHSLLVLFDIRSLSSGFQDKLRDVFIDNDGKRMDVTLSSAFDPSSVPISCVVAQVAHTDSKVQTKQVTSSMETPKSTAKSSVNVRDNETPSTSTSRRKSGRVNVTPKTPAQRTRLSLSPKKLK